ncbi:hypothetical protein D5086_009644 [Populus alba]|uniref:Uncharacterized protein n=1 Tax=Populus alba TaxID=43335 RepID=A0ACC4C7Y7_POPAL
MQRFRFPNLTRIDSAKTINKASFFIKESPRSCVPDLSGPRVSLFFIQALANALAAAPSMWTLGNAGMGALQRLAEDKNPAIANAASKTIHELNKQWEIQEGDSWRFMMNQKPVEEVDSQEDNNDADTG